MKQFNGQMLWILTSLFGCARPVYLTSASCMVSLMEIYKAVFINLLFIALMMLHHLRAINPLYLQQLTLLEARTTSWQLPILSLARSALFSLSFSLVLS